MTTRHPNAKASGFSGGAAVLIVAALTAAGVKLSPVTSAAVVAVTTTTIIAIGREGLAGLARHLWRGPNTK